jgi:hypothetical protein
MVSCLVVFLALSHNASHAMRGSGRHPHTTPTQMRHEGGAYAASQTFHSSYGEVGYAAGGYGAMPAGYPYHVVMPQGPMTGYPGYHPYHESPYATAMAMPATHVVDPSVDYGYTPHADPYPIHTAIWNLDIERANCLFDSMDPAPQVELLLEKNQFGNNILHQILKRIDLVFKDFNPTPTAPLVDFAYKILSLAAANYVDYIDLDNSIGDKPAHLVQSAKDIFYRAELHKKLSCDSLKPFFQDQQPTAVPLVAPQPPSPKPLAHPSTAHADPAAIISSAAVVSTDAPAAAPSLLASPQHHPLTLPAVVKSAPASPTGSTEHRIIFFSEGDEKPLLGCPTQATTPTTLVPAEPATAPKPKAPSAWTKRPNITPDPAPAEPKNPTQLSGATGRAAPMTTTAHVPPTVCHATARFAQLKLDDAPTPTPVIVPAELPAPHAAAQTSPAPRELATRRELDASPEGVSTATTTPTTHEDIFTILETGSLKKLTAWLKNGKNKKSLCGQVLFDASGRTPLFAALEGGHIKAAEHLATINPLLITQKNRNQRSPLDFILLYARAEGSTHLPNIAQLNELFLIWQLDVPAHYKLHDGNSVEYVARKLGLCGDGEAAASEPAKESTPKGKGKGQGKGRRQALTEQKRAIALAAAEAAAEKIPGAMVTCDQGGHPQIVVHHNTAAIDPILKAIRENRVEVLKDNPEALLLLDKACGATNPYYAALLYSIDHLAWECMQYLLDEKITTITDSIRQHTDANFLHAVLENNTRSKRCSQGDVLRLMKMLCSHKSVTGLHSRKLREFVNHASSATGATPLHLAICLGTPIDGEAGFYTSFDGFEVVKYLLSLGANPNICRTTKDGSRPHLLDDAAVNATVNIISLLMLQPGMVLARQKCFIQKANIRNAKLEAVLHEHPDLFDHLGGQRLLWLVNEGAFNLIKILTAHDVFSKEEYLSNSNGINALTMALEYFNELIKSGNREAIDKVIRPFLEQLLSAATIAEWGEVTHSDKQSLLDISIPAFEEYCGTTARLSTRGTTQEGNVKTDIENFSVAWSAAPNGLYTVTVEFFGKKVILYVTKREFDHYAKNTLRFLEASQKQIIACDDVEVLQHLIKCLPVDTMAAHPEPYVDYCADACKVGALRSMHYLLDSLGADPTLGLAADDVASTSLLDLALHSKSGELIELLAGRMPEVLLHLLKSRYRTQAQDAIINRPSILVAAIMNCRDTELLARVAVYLPCILIRQHDTKLGDPEAVLTVVRDVLLELLRNSAIPQARLIEIVPLNESHHNLFSYVTSFFMALSLDAGNTYHAPYTDFFYGPIYEALLARVEGSIEARIDAWLAPILPIDSEFASRLKSKLIAPASAE